MRALPHLKAPIPEPVVQALQALVVLLGVAARARHIGHQQHLARILAQRDGPAIQALRRLHQQATRSLACHRQHLSRLSFGAMGCHHASLPACLPAYTRVYIAAWQPLASVVAQPRGQAVQAFTRLQALLDT